MKLIEAMKKVKSNKDKIADLQKMIDANCANLGHETPVYGPETRNKINEWLQACTDLSQENVRLLCAIQRTNLNTNVAVEVEKDKHVTKTIAEWIWRRREYAALDLATYSKLTDRNLKEGFVNTSTGTQMEIKIVRQFDPERRDKIKMMYKNEPSLIDATLEIVNAVTDLVE